MNQTRIERIHVHSSWIPKMAYRYLSNEAHARAFAANGDVWISTLHHSRNVAFENCDVDEAKQYLIVPCLGPSTPQDQRERILHRLAEFGMDAEGKELRNVNLQREDEDAYVLFLSRSEDAYLRTHCVEISHPQSFFRTLGTAINRRMQLKEDMFAPVHYNERFVFGAAGKMLRPAITGHPEYSEEDELRMLWWKEFDEPISPFLLPAHEVAKYCRFMDERSCG